MSIKLGLNGFGRIGRLCLRAAMERGDEFELCAINIRNANPEYMAYQLRYDSVFGRFNGTVEAVDGNLVINGRTVKIFSESDAANLDWASVGAEYILETTGAYLTTEKCAAHLAAGARKVIISAPAKDDTPTYVMGVNHMDYTPDQNVVSNASCTTNCLAPLTKVIHDRFGIVEGLMSTIHAATAKQKAVDARNDKDWRIGRSLFGNIIPSTTGAAKAVGKVIPSLNGKLTGMSFRIPAADASVVDLTAKLATPATFEEICAALKEASETTMKGVLAYTDEPLVSRDFVGESCTCTFDAEASIMLGSDFVKLIAWYDNEWGYSCKMLELTKHIHEVCSR